MNKWQLTRQGHLDLREGTAAREGVTWTLEILLESLHLFLAARPVTGGLSCQVAACNHDAGHPMLQQAPSTDNLPCARQLGGNGSVRVAWQPSLLPGGSNKVT